MTQDQHDPARDPGRVRGDVVAGGEADEFTDEQSRPMTRFQKVASALRGEKPDPAAPDEMAQDRVAQDQPVSERPVSDLPAPDQAMAEHTVIGPDERADTGGPTMAPHTGYDSQAATGAFTAEARAAGRHAADAEDAGLRPGEATERLGDFGDIAFGNLLPDAEMYTAQWEQIQFRFVDDPQGSVIEAADVISQVTMKLEAAIQERQRAIQERQLAIQERASALRGRWGEGSNADTETLRETLRMYRAFMDQLVGPVA
jgi:hypothetical protein